MKRIYFFVPIFLVAGACASVGRQEADQPGMQSYGSIYEALDRMPNVQITADQRIRIRGSQDDPLIVIDGQPMAGTDLSFLNLYEVTSLRIGTMADASRYGIRASGGVVFIETKRPPARN